MDVNENGTSLMNDNPSIFAAGRENRIFPIGNYCNFVDMICMSSSSSNLIDLTIILESKIQKNTGSDYQVQKYFE